MALEYKYVHARNGNIFVAVEMEDRKKIIPVDSGDFRNYLIYKLFLLGRTISADGLNNIITLLCAKAQFEAEEIITAERVGKNRGTFYYDLANDLGQCVRITSKGYKILNQSPVVFVRSSVLLEQVKPKVYEDIDVWDLNKYFNVAGEDDFILLVVHILSCFIPEIPHHILIFLGNQGSAKSTASRLIKQIVDPSIVDISAIPKNKEDLILQLSSEYLIAYDNISTLKSEYNDIFCQLVTGGNFLKRKLYTDGELVAYSYKRCLILNGISYLTTQADLLDRSIVITLKKISGSNRKTENEVFDSFNKELPYILHSIFETIAKAKKIHKTLKIKKLPRMADAVKWQCAICEALGINHEDYLDIYYQNQSCVNEEILSAHPVAYVIMLFMEKKKIWKGSISKLWGKLDSIAALKNINRNDSLWARSPSSLSRQLNQLKVNLEKTGIFFDVRNVGKHKEITLRNRESGDE